RSPGMVGEHENGGVIRRVIAPPALPAVVRPGSSHRPEHVAAHDPGSDVVEPACREIVVDPGRATVASVHLPKRTGRENPFVQRDPADAERVAEILVGTGAVSVERYGEAMDAELGHWID